MVVALGLRAGASLGDSGGAQGCRGRWRIVGCGERQRGVRRRRDRRMVGREERQRGVRDGGGGDAGIGGGTRHAAAQGVRGWLAGGRAGEAGGRRREEG
jgi:hypothetical protein